MKAVAQAACAKETDAGTVEKRERGIGGSGLFQASARQPLTGLVRSLGHAQPREKVWKARQATGKPLCARLRSLEGRFRRRAALRLCCPVVGL